MTSPFRLNRWLASAALAAALSGGALMASPAQAATGDFSITLTFNGSSQQSCMSSKDVTRALRAKGYRNVSVVRDLGRHRVLAIGTLKGKWYQLRVNTCSGLVDDVRRLKRDNDGNFTFYLNFSSGPVVEQPRDELVCLVTFFDEDEVEGGADADVESARVLPRSEAEERDRPNDRRRIFDYGTNRQTEDTCEYLDSINN